MIVAINPSDRCFEESNNTLKYANRAKNIKVNSTMIHSRVNKMNTSLLENLRIEQLEEDNEKLRSMLKKIEFHMSSNSHQRNSVSDLSVNHQNKKKCT